MPLPSTFLLGLALAMDCFAISICLGLQAKNLNWRRAVQAPLTFGLFQGLMPLLGWALGLTVQPLIESFDHWFAFILLVGVGGHMLKEAWSQYTARTEKNSGSCAAEAGLPTTAGRPFFTLLSLGLATSLDALAVGLGMAFAEVSLWVPALIIGGTTFAVSLAGLLAGHSLGRFVQGTHYAVGLGGCVLIGLAVKILMVHGVF